MAGTIQKGIPIPLVKYKGGGSDCRYVWPEMEAGDSVWYESKTKNQQASIRTAAHTWFRRNKPHFRVITRTEWKERKQGVRVWIIKEE